MPPSVTVPARVIRDKFIREGYFAAWKAQAYRERVKSQSHDPPPAVEEPHCTWSQLVEYLDVGGERVMLCHQYMRPDGTLGGSGLPDPKWLLAEGVIYKAGAG